MLEERPAEAVGEEGDLVGAALLLDLQELLRGEVEGLLPGDVLEVLLPARAGPPEERLLQPVGVVEEAGAAGAADVSTGAPCASGATGAGAGFS